MKIAVVGSGIAGLSSALLAKLNGHEVILLEKNNYFGGHSNTIDFNDGKSTFPVDTGFLVHNRNTYPNLIKMFEYLKVETVESEMTLSIRLFDENIEWGGTNLNTLFAQKSNLLKPRFYRMIRDILKFNSLAKEYLQISKQEPELTLGQLLERFKYSEEVKNWYLVPMAAAIWSTPADKILDFPAFTFFEFCINHSLLQVNDRPVWRTVKGGSRQYVQKIVDQIEIKHLSANIGQIKRVDGKIEIELPDQVLKVDKIIMACHADQAIKLITDMTPLETAILSKFQFQPNLAVVHSDPNILPIRKSIWSAWNYSSKRTDSRVAVSYLINKLQPLPTKTPVIVTLNPNLDLNQQTVDRQIQYEHPLFDTQTIRAQSELLSIQGTLNTYYVGAWQGYGFHEDGLTSSLRLAKLLDWKVPWA